MIRDTRNKLLAQVILAISQIAFPLITYPIVTKALGPGGLGTVNYTDSIIQAFLVLATLGIPIYGIREIAIQKKNRDQQSKTFSSLFFLQLFSLVPAIIFMWIIGMAGGADHMLLVTGTIGLAASCLSFEWFLQGNERFVFLALRSILIKGISVLLVWMLIQERDDYVLYYSILTGSVVLIMLLNLATILPRVKFSFNTREIRQHFHQLNWIFGCYLFASLYAIMDSILLGWLSSEEIVGYYSFGYKLVRMSAMILPVLGAIFIPRIAFHYSLDNRNAISQQADHSLELIFFLGIPFSFFFFTMAPEIVSVFANEMFERTVIVIRILSPLPLLIGLSHFTGSQVLLSIKKEKVFFILLLAGWCINLVLNLVLIPVYLEKAAAVSNLVMETFLVLSTMIYLYKTKLLKL